MCLQDCPYNECYLPENNNKYLWQIGFLLVSLGVMIISPEQFNFFSIALYIAPVLLDLIDTSVDNKLLKGLRTLFTMLNSILLVFALLGMIHLIEDNGVSFSVIKSALLFSNFTIEKRWLAVALLCNLAVPGIFWIGAPSKKKMQRMQEMKEAVHR